MEPKQIEIARTAGLKPFRFSWKGYSVTQWAKSREEARRVLEAKLPNRVFKNVYVKGDNDGSAT
jgi:hypothetical protein